MKTLTSIAAATSLVAGTCLPTALAFATPPDVGGQSGAGSTDMTMVWQNPNQEYGGTGITDDTDPAYNPDGDGDGYGDNLAFTAPSKINFVAKASGELLAPGSSAIHIDNHTAYGIQVSSVKVDENTDDGWNIVEDQASAAGVANAVWGEIGPSGYALNWYGCKTAAAETAAGHWNMAAEGAASDADKLFLSTSGNVSNLSLDLSSEKTFGTIQWFLKAGNASVPSNLPTPKASLAAYSISELKAISEDLSENADESIFWDEFNGYVASGATWTSPELNLTGVSGIDENLADADKVMQLRIIGINHDDKADGTGKAGLTMMAAHALPKAYAVETRYDGYHTGHKWEEMELYANLNSGEIWNMMPSSIQEAVVPVTKTTGYFDSNVEEQLSSATHKLFIPSYIEIVGSHYTEGNTGLYQDQPEVVAYLTGEGRQYAYFSTRIVDGGTNNSSNPLIANMNLLNSGAGVYDESWDTEHENPLSWWERTMEPKDGENYVVCAGNGCAMDLGATVSYVNCVIPCFCI